MCTLFCLQPSIKCFLWNIVLSILVSKQGLFAVFGEFGVETHGVQSTEGDIHLQLLCRVKEGSGDLKSSQALIPSSCAVKGRDCISDTKDQCFQTVSEGNRENGDAGLSAALCSEGPRGLDSCPRGRRRVADVSAPWKARAVLCGELYYPSLV